MTKCEFAIGLYATFIVFCVAGGVALRFVPFGPAMAIGAVAWAMAARGFIRMIKPAPQRSS